MNDAGTREPSLADALAPWSSCAAFTAATLGLSTPLYLPCAVRIERTEATQLEENA